MACITGVLGALICSAQTSYPTAKLSLVPLYPADGVFSKEMEGHHVFLKRDGQFVVSYDSGVGGRRVELPIVFPNQIDVEMASTLSRNEGGEFVYGYQISNRKRTPQAVERVFLTVPRMELLKTADLDSKVLGWRRDEVELFGPQGEGIGWFSRTREIQPGATADELVLRTKILPGLVTALLEGARILPVRWEELPAAVREEIASLEKAGYGCTSTVVVGPKFSLSTNPYVILWDYSQQIDLMTRTGVLSPSSPFVLQVRAELQKYMDSVRAVVEYLEDNHMKPALSLTEKPATPSEKLLWSALTLSLEPGL
jgi:hypothetical protein